MDFKNFKTREITVLSDEHCVSGTLPTKRKPFLELSTPRHISPASFCFRCFLREKEEEASVFVFSHSAALWKSQYYPPDSEPETRHTLTEEFTRNKDYYRLLTELRP